MLSSPRAGVPTHRSVRAYPRGKRDRRTLIVDTSPPRSESDTDRGQHHVDREQGDDAQDQRLVDGGSDALRAAGDGEAAVAADETGDQAKRAGLDDGNH